MSIITDFEAIASNSLLSATALVNFWTTDSSGNPILNSNIPVKGFLLNGFNQNFSNEFNDLLSETSGQSNLSDIGAGVQAIGSAIGLSGSFFNYERRVQSVLQTIQTWKKFNVPTFSIELLFFDSTGSGFALKNAEILHLTQIPYAEMGGDSNLNLTLRAPAGYAPAKRDSLNDKTAGNRTFSLTASGTCKLSLMGGHIFMDDILLIGVQNQFSDIVLNTGHPLFVKSTLTFKYWRMVMQEDVQNMYPTNSL